MEITCIVISHFALGFKRIGANFFSEPSKDYLIFWWLNAKTQHPHSTVPGFQPEIYKNPTIFFVLIDLNKIYQAQYMQ